MKREKDVRYWINHCSWEHGYNKEKLADVAEELMKKDKTDGFSIQIEGDTLDAKKSGQWLFWTLTTKDGRVGKHKGFTYICMDCSPFMLSRQLCYALMKTALDASLSEEQRKAEILIDEILHYYWAFESLGGQLEGNLPKAVHQVGRKIIRLSKEDTRDAFYQIFISISLSRIKEIDLDKLDEKWVRSRIDWYLVHLANH